MEEVQKTTVFQAFRNFRCILSIFGLRFQNWKTYNEPFRKFFLNCRLVLLGAVCWIFIYFTASNLGKTNVKNLMLSTATLLGVIWLYESILGMWYLVYWQISGHFDTFALLLERCDGAEGVKESVGTMRKVQIAVFFVAASFGAFNSYQYIHGEFLPINATKQVTVPDHLESMVEMWPSNTAVRIGLKVMIVWANMAWLINMSFYMLCCLCIYLQAAHFNRVLAQNVCSLRAKYDVLEKYLVRYADLCCVLDHVNKNMFSGYIFWQLCACLPTFVLTLYVTINSWFDTVIHNSLVYSYISLLCFLQLFILTGYPSYIHEEMHETREIFYRENSLWYPHDLKTHEILNSFCNRIGMSSLGISVWGFATITKGLMLSVLSIIITYLAILVQFKERHAMLNYVAENENVVEEAELDQYLLRYMERVQYLIAGQPDGREPQSDSDDE